MAFMFHSSCFSYLYQLLFIVTKPRQEEKKREGRFILVHGLSRCGPSGWGKCAHRQLHGNTNVRLFAHVQRSGCRMRLVPVLSSHLPLLGFFHPSYKLQDGTTFMQNGSFPLSQQSLIHQHRHTQTCFSISSMILSQIQIAIKINHLSSSISSSDLPAWKFSLNTPQPNIPSHVCLCFACQILVYS